MEDVWFSRMIGYCVFGRGEPSMWFMAHPLLTLKHYKDHLFSTSTNIGRPFFKWKTLPLQYTQYSSIQPQNNYVPSLFYVSNNTLLHECNDNCDKLSLYRLIARIARTKVSELLLLSGCLTQHFDTHGNASEHWSIVFIVFRAESHWNMITR